MLDTTNTGRVAGFLAALTLAGCVTADATAQTSAPNTAARWTCHTRATCAGRTDLRAHDLCLGATRGDTLPGAAAAEDFAAVWRAACAVDEGQIEAVGEGRACVDELGAEPWGCSITCEYQGQGCEVAS